MVQDMLVCEQTQGQSVYDHGLSVREHTLQILDYIRGRGGVTLEGWRIPKWLDEYKSGISNSIWDDEIISLYTLYHDCGKPYCRTVDDDGKVHFPDHAAVSAEVFAHVESNEDAEDVAKLISWDMVLHTETQKQIKKRLQDEMSEEDVFTLLIVGLAELHSNAKLFGGIESISFKMKWKKLDKRGRWLCKEFLIRDDKVTIKRKDIECLWHCGFWDGPLSGICLYEGEKCWFDMVKEYNNGSRTFKIVRLTQEQFKEEEYWHDLFERKFARTTCANLRQEYQDERKNRKERDFSKNEIIGCSNNIRRA